MGERLRSQGRCVLLVEDQAIVCLDLEDHLTASGYQVGGPFSHCAEALQWLEHHTPDMAILDIQLADGLSVDLARELQARDVPFLFYTGCWERAADLPDDLQDLKWVEKPALPSALLTRLEALSRSQTGLSPISSAQS